MASVLNTSFLVGQLAAAAGIIYGAWLVHGASLRRYLRLLLDAPRAGSRPARQRRKSA